MFQVTLIPYFKSVQNEILYAIVRPENQICPLALIGNGTTQETLRHTAIETFAELTGMFLNPIRFQRLMCQVTVPITEIQETISDENILLFPKYYFGVHLPHQIKNNVSKQVAFDWLPYERVLPHYSFIVDKYALWELNNRLLLDKTDILPNQQLTKPKAFK